jgi:hypothetical protein
MPPGCASRLIAMHSHCHYTAIQKMIIGRLLEEYWATG